MTPEEGVQRWDAFLAKIDARAKEILAEAEQGCAMLLDMNALDPLPMSNAWTGIETQLHDLGKKIDDTWSEKVASVLEDRAGEEDKGHALRRRIDRAREEVGIKIFGEAAQKIYDEAKRRLSADFRCTQCRAPLEVSNQFFRSKHVPCQYCKNVNTFVPGSLVTAVEWFCVHHLARARSAKEWFHWMDVEYGDRATAEAALKANVAAYLKARIAIVPEYEKDYDKDFKGRMAQFYERV